MNRIIFIVILSVFVGHCFAQDTEIKNYRLSFISSIDYSRIAYPIKYEYTSTIFSGQVVLNGAGKLAGGIGIRLEYNFESRAHFMISGMMLDKGFNIVYEWSGLNNGYVNGRSRFREFYLSFPFEVVYRLRSNLNSTYFKSGISFDIDVERKQGYNPIASSIVMGVGKSFLINEILLVSIEPTFRYSIYNYGENVWIFNDKKERYRPISIGIMIVLTQ